MSNIFTRSPFLAVVDNGSTTSKVELFIWNSPSSEPTLPTRTLSKVAPSLTNTYMQFNISPYIRKYISFKSITTVDTPSVPLGTNVNQYCFCRVKIYGNGTLISSTVYNCFDGYTRYEDNTNFDNGNVMLDEGTYEYWMNNPLSVPSVERAGNLTLLTGTSWTAKYTNLNTGATFTLNLLNNKVQDIYRVYRSYHSDGNLLEIFDGSSVLQKSFTFKPKLECKYTPVTIDFVNRYGAWQREFFFKASNNTVNVENKQFNMFQGLSTTYQVQQGTRAIFNSRTIESIKVNSDFRSESFGSVVEQIISSEKWLVNELPAVCTTQSIEKFKDVNTKLQNYILDFQMAYTNNNTVQ